MEQKLIYFYGAKVNIDSSICGNCREGKRYTPTSQLTVKHSSYTKAPSPTQNQISHTLINIISLGVAAAWRHTHGIKLGNKCSVNLSYD